MNRVTIRLRAHGLPCWHVVEVAPLKMPLLRRLMAGEDIDVTAIGRVVESGWGEPPAAMPDYSAITD